MNLLINGITNNDYITIETSLEALDSDHHTYFKLRDMNINYCKGCWDCWLKTPGKCVFKDDYEAILSKIPQADSITIVSPVIIGYVSSLVKTFQDRFIPFAHPYIISYKGEQHHRRRYPHSPIFNIILLEDENTTQEDINLIKEYYERVVLNFHSTVEKFTTIKKGEDYNDVINGI